VRPFAGKLTLRLNPQVDAASVPAEELAGVRLNQWSEQALAKAVGVRAVLVLPPIRLVLARHLP